MPLILNAGVYVLKGRAVTFEAYFLFFRSKKQTNKQKQRHRFTEELSKLMVLYEVALIGVTFLHEFRVAFTIQKATTEMISLASKEKNKQTKLMANVRH